MKSIKTQIEELKKIDLESFDIDVLIVMQSEIKIKQDKLLKRIEKLKQAIEGAAIEMPHGYFLSDIDVDLGLRDEIDASMIAGRTLLGAGIGGAASGSGNTLVGNASGYQIAAGEFNTALGNQTASNLVGGDYNTYIGSGSGGGAGSGAFGEARGSFCSY